MKPNCSLYTPVTYGKYPRGGAMSLFIFSQMIGKPIFDPNREKVAVLKDIVVYINPDEGKSEEIYPSLAVILAHTQNRYIWLPALQIAVFD